MASPTPAGTTPYYFIPAPSQHPVMVSVGMLLVIFGASQWVNGHGYGSWLVLSGLVVWGLVMFRWFGDAIRESEGGLYSDRIDVSFRWSMGWFIFSEVMFFAAFFGALYWARVFSVPMLGDLNHQVLWPDFKAVWPSTGAGFTASPAGTVEPFQTMGPFWLPTINTALLLTSGVTLTIAHHALIANQRSKTVFWMWVTVALGATFLCVQAYEYVHAYRDLNLKLLRRSGDQPEARPQARRSAEQARHLPDRRPRAGDADRAGQGACVRHADPGSARSARRRQDQRRHHHAQERGQHAVQDHLGGASHRAGCRQRREG